MAYKRSIQQSLMRGCIVFILCLCVILSAQSYLLFTAALYQRYNDRLEFILDHVESTADADDLAECVRTGVPSEHYRHLQEMLNLMVDDFRLTYLYLIVPLDTQTGTMMNVVSATSQAEREAGVSDIPLLYTSDAYPREEVQRYLNAWNGQGVTYFRETSGFGTYYTACKPLRDSCGGTVALMCADIPIDELYLSVRWYVLWNVAATILICTIFGVALLWWLRRNVTGPVLALEQSTRSFAARSRDTRDVSKLSYDAPDIHTLNEVESLADAIARMSEDIREYVEEILSAEGRVKVVEEEMADISHIAYQDPLTKVKNKAAWYEKMTDLSAEIAGGAAEFAIMMVDMNNLKRVNDTYGHEKGDQYIIGSCQIISGIFKRSPVYRIGGDEFVVVLQGEDYKNRDQLRRTMEERFRAAQTDGTREPWTRYSAAAGMAVYSGAGESVKHVLKRADELMYANKQRMKSVMALELLEAGRSG